jgi:stalled ribosome rescue protein Dom34
LVGAPPSAIGKFGADTDNWTWPRHTGDFALFRIYMSPDGKPAEYSEDNIPFKPKHHLPISLSGVKKDDFVMILGYPGSTDRYLTSYGVQNNVKYKNPTIVEVREKKLAVMREFMNKDDAVRIQYATKYAQTSNYWKYFIGQTQQLKNNRVFEKKMILENDLKSWIEADPAREKKYGKALSQIEEAYNHMNKYEVALWYYLEAVIRGPEVILMSYRYNALTNAIKEKRGDEIINNIAKNLKSQLDKHFKDYYVEIDKKMMAELIMMFNKNVHSTLVPKEILKLKNQPANRVYAFVDKLYKNTIFTDKEKIEKALDNSPKIQYLFFQQVY